MFFQSLQVSIFHLHLNDGSSRQEATVVHKPWTWPNALGGSYCAPWKLTIGISTSMENTRRGMQGEDARTKATEHTFLNQGKYLNINEYVAGYDVYIYI